MKTLQITAYGKIEKKLAFMDMEIPKITADEVLIEVYFAGVNPIDYKIIEGAMKVVNKLKFPAAIGFDFSGKIVKKGENVTDFDIGDHVYSRVPLDNVGTFAEYISLKSDLISKIPQNLTLEEAASIPLVGLTVFQAMEKAKLKKGDKILIHAGSGGVGTFAIQYAKSKGAFVYTTTSTKNVEWVKKLGADRVIDYKTEDYLTIAKDLDIVFDTLGQNYTSEAFQLIKKGGSVISIAGDLDEQTAKELGLNSIIRFFLSLKRIKITKLMKAKGAFYTYLFMKANTSDLNQISKLIEQNAVKPVIDKVFDFDEAIEALLYLKSARAKGKVLLKIK